MDIEIRIMSQSEEVLFSGEFFSLPVSEEYIIEKSKELFLDPEPCIVCRNYIINKMNICLHELGQILKDCPSGEILLDRIPKQIKELFLFYKWDAARILIKKE